MSEATTQHQFFLTPKAAEQVKAQLNKRGTPDAYLRLGLKGSGYSGYQYAIQFEDNSPREHDIVLVVEGVSVVIDKKSIVYLNGATLDWQQTLMYQGFKFVNKLETNSCGCGASVSF